MRTENDELMASIIVSGRLCPYIGRLLSRCYCADMASIKVEEAIYYCGANYGQCKTYQDIKAKDECISFSPAHSGGEKRV